MSQEIQSYRPGNADIQLDVLVENETVWLTQKQMELLFQRDVSVISRHINNIFKERELAKEGNLHFLQIANADRPVAFYSLDVIISVGYRVKSQRGTEFRIWATKVLKDCFIQGAVVNQRFELMENRLSRNEAGLQTVNQRIDELVQAALPPRQGVFFNGQVFDAHAFVADLIRSAGKSVTVVDSYADDSVLAQLTKRNLGVTAAVCVAHLTAAFRNDVERHNLQYEPVEVRVTPGFHDRFLLLDGKQLYHFGASFKDLGRKLFCFTLIESEAVITTVRSLAQEP